MAQPYFRYVPNFEYVSRLNGAKNISDFIEVKNLFKRVRLSEEVLGQITFFTKYKIVGDERPDQIAYKVYGDQNLDWLVMLSNNIINLENEWPLSQESFYNYVINKYGEEGNINNVHHYETRLVKDNRGRTVLKKGLEVSQDFSITYFDSGIDREVTINNVTEGVTNYEYEEGIQDAKRNIYLLKEKYLVNVLNGIEAEMPYKEGSTQYITEELIRGENIRLYQ